MRAQRKGAAGVTGHVIANVDRAALAIAEKAEDLRGFAIKTRAEIDVGGNGIFPPITFDAAFVIDVAHALA